MKQGYFMIYGRMELCNILASHPFGTVDVERVSDGKCFRITGVWDEN